MLRVNTALLRRRITSPKLKFIETTVGKTSNTLVSVAYLEGTADGELVNTVIEKLKGIEIEEVVSTASIEEHITSHPYSIFPQTIYTERPDKLAACISEGKIGLFIDGYPLGYVIPAVLNMFFQAPEDYSQNYLTASILRCIRYIAALITVLLPGLYVSTLTFNIEMLPAKLALSIIKSKEGVPFTTIIEVLFMLIAFEILIEAGVRLPKTMGQATSIVGGLIVGDAAISAKFVSPAVVVVIAIASICGFLMPNQDFANSLRLLRFTGVLMAAFAGIYGMSLGIILLLYYFAGLKTCGVPYMLPYAAADGKNLGKDTLFRTPFS